MAYNILLVDDDKEFREEFRDFLYDYGVIEASSGEEALAALSRPNEIDVVILDVIMPGLKGTEVLKRIKAMCPGLGVIILTGHGTKATVIEALKGRADDYIEKPVDIHRTREIVERLIRKKQLPGEAPPGGLDAKIKRVVHFLDRNYDKRVSLKDAAELVALSPKYLSRVFKETTGTGFDEYRLMVRIDKAEELLVTTDYSVEEIAYRVGYENAESLARLFKKMRGCTPTTHREKRRAEGTEPKHDSQD
jgi:YesN/AraC family two-component response regulator